MLAAACTTLLPRQYEYDEEVNLSLDGSATVYVNGSVPAFVALHGIDLDTRPTARLDRAAVRRFFTSEVVVGHAPQRVASQRAPVHSPRLAVSDVRRLSQAAPFSWATYSMQRRGDQYVYMQTRGRSGRT